MLRNSYVDRLLRARCTAGAGGVKILILRPKRFLIGEPGVPGGWVHIRWAMGYMNMTTFSAVRIPIRTQKGTMVKRRRAAVRYLRWVIARRVYRDPARPRARNVYCRTWIGPLPTSIVEPVYFPPNSAPTVEMTEPPSASRWNMLCARCAATSRGIRAYPNLAKFLKVFSRFPAEAILAARVSRATGMDTPTANTAVKMTG